MDRFLRPRAVGLLTALLMGGIALLPSTSSGDLAGRYSAHQKQANQLKTQIGSESQRIAGYEGTIGNLQGRLNAIELSAAIQERLLGQVRVRLTLSRNRLAALEHDFVRDRRLLAAQLVARYESPPPTVVDVVVNSHGFNDLLNRLRDVTAIERQNAQAVAVVKTVRAQVATQTRQLSVEQSRRERATAAVLVERDQIAELKLSIVNRELVFARARSEHQRQLNTLRGQLTREAKILEQRAIAAQHQSFGTGGAPIGGCVNTPFVAHGGSTGFFPAAGTDYSVGEEPMLAARLDTLGRSLGLHLIGISGYRSPQHSVEVGGFADDPHTQGIASDTPGVEGVPESTLLRFCLTRPFGGAREADHIQPS